MPIPLDKISHINHIVVHDNCSDGTASALLLKHCLPNAKVSFVQYKTRQHQTLPVEPGTIFADFSPHEDQVDDFIGMGAVVLDHHKTQQGVVEAFGENGVFGDEKKDPGVCGALLVFREVFKPLMESYGKTVPNTPDIDKIQDFATLIGIRDTWQNKHERWHEAREVSEAIDFWPWDSHKSLRDLDAKLEIGPILLERKLKTAKKKGDDAWRFTTSSGTRVAVIEGVKLTSDTAEYLDTNVDLLVGFNIFMIDGEPSIVFSTRSHTFFDCASFAKVHGGGGHTKAAGFAGKLDPKDPQPHTLIRRVVEHYELTGKKYGSKLSIRDRLRYLKWRLLQ